MKPPIKTRAMALVASICMTVATVWSVADHAYPQPRPVLLASAR
jgi:hypothetical protein